MARSPNYPRISLPDALQRVGDVWHHEGKNPLSTEAISHILGYKSYNGSAQGVVSALRKYGLLEGTAAGLRVTARAMQILEAEEDSEGRAKAIREAALEPDLFAGLAEEFPSIPTESTLRLKLLNMKYSKTAAETAARNYRATMGLVAETGGGYNGEEESSESAQVEEETPMRTAAGTKTPQQQAPPTMPPTTLETDIPPVIFPLPRGNAVEIRLKSRLTQEEFEQLRKLFDLLAPSLIETN